MNPRYARPSIFDPQVRKHRPDYGLVIIASILLVVGLIVMYSISPALDAQAGGANNHYVLRQFLAVTLGLVAFAVTSKIPLKYWGRWLKPLVIAAFVLSIMTVILGGLSNRWIQLGTFSFQPVELVKFALVVGMSAFLVKAANEGRHTQLSKLKPLLLSFLIFGVVIVVLQRDLGSAFVLLCMAGVIAYIAGLPMKKLLLFIGIAIAVVVMAIGSTAYRRDRLYTYLRPERDCVDTGYHACQALIAVGSGGLIGQGLGRGVQAYGYLPDAANDSIFAVYAEKFGFIGAVGLVVLFGTLLLRILNIMQRAPNMFAQIICAGVFTWLGIQAMVNIGAMIGLLPLKGITLPFISSGGTSLVFVMAALGIVFHISNYTSMRNSVNSYANERDSDESDYHWRGHGRSRYAATRHSL